LIEYPANEGKYFTVDKKKKGRGVERGHFFLKKKRKEIERKEVYKWFE